LRGLDVHAECILNHDRLNEYFLAHASEVQLLAPPQLKGYAVEKFDRLLFIYAPSNWQAASHVPLERQIHTSKANQPIMQTILTRKASGQLRWCRTHYPILRWLPQRPLYRPLPTQASVSRAYALALSLGYIENRPFRPLCKPMQKMWVSEPDIFFNRICFRVSIGGSMNFFFWLLEHLPNFIGRKAYRA
jgi:hypothetical protein